MNILLLEPNYKNKYPPLGLMKIATFHKNLGHNVVFSKGVNESLCKHKWDRIYVNSLFTFEWHATQKMIKFAYKLTNDKSNIFLGGIAATLLSDYIASQEPQINIVSGLLDTPGKLKCFGDETIDSLPPDYSILEQISYKYPTDDAYFSYSTRGCGMNCSFCAVQRLEPTYIDYICIKDQINSVEEHCGEKRHLLLMDNNVLKSPKLANIISDIIDLGFGKGAHFKNPKTGKTVQRYVDFNQGLDANFLTSEKASLLAKIELKPARIAFDHIKQKDKYEKAIRTCFNAGLRSFSNYLLYNTNEASWKGNSYGADTPEDLYNRLKYNVNLCETLQRELASNNIDETVQIYSFPMRYIPLDNIERGYIGTHWNKKTLRAIQVFLNPTQGKGVSSKKFFNTAFGKTLDEYLLALYMPENVLMRRGTYIPRKSDSDETIIIKKQKSMLNANFVIEWKMLYEQLKAANLWNEFIETYVKENLFTFEAFCEIKNPLQKAMYLYYLPIIRIKNNYPNLPLSDKNFINNHLRNHGKYLSQLINI